MNMRLFRRCLLACLAGGVIVLWGCLPADDTSPAAEEPGAPFYFGLPKKPVYSTSVVDSPKSSYVFEPVLQFDLVRHDFIVRNTSGSMLELKKVQACCGSLVESYSRQIPAGKEGVIRTVLLTDRRGGEEIHGTVSALTNDPRHPEWTIDISCHVEKFAEISHHTIMLSGPWQTAIQGSSVVIPTDKYPFRITSLKAKRGIFITYGYRETVQDGRKAYIIWAENTRKGAGVIRDTIYVQTDNPARPEFMIRVQGRLTN